MRRRRVLLAVALALLATGLLAWRYQSVLIGRGAHWYLARVAARERAAGTIEGRRQAVARMNRLLLLEPPSDAMVPELFDVMTFLSARIATGEVSPNWGAYLYTKYVRDMARDRPTGEPKRDTADVEADLKGAMEFYAIQKRPEEAGIRAADLLGVGGESYTVEEIEQAAREGRELPLR